MSNRLLRIYKNSSLFLLSAVFLVAGDVAALAAGSRVLPDGELPMDSRLGPLKDLNGYFPFEPSKSRENWEPRAERLRRRVLVATGLWPMPAKTPANAVIHGRIDRGDYTVEKVYFESCPGHFVTGNLYRPVGRTGKLPGVLCPHGHWSNGRFHEAGDDEVRESIVNGAERFLIGGKSPLQSRCVQLARMGCVVFHYDMLGYADSVQIEHRPGVREHMNSPENWGFFSPQAELRLQTMMGLQTYNSVRALDFLCSLTDVDPERIGITGASGGGTQTFILGAIDPRPKAAFPAVMVSTAMQGGCTCENASCLRVDSGNIHMAALFAPKPLGMTGANDWTVEIATKGLPELKEHYAMLGVKDLVTAKPLLHFGHNYNFVSRAVMYSWFNKHLKLGYSDPILEDDYVPLTKEQMSVWNDQHPRPPSGDDYERSLLRWMTEESERQIAALSPQDGKSSDEFHRVIGGALEAIVGRESAMPDAIEYEMLDKQDQGDYWLFKALLRNTSHKEELPTVFLHPKSWNGQVVVWVDGSGKASLFSEETTPTEQIASLLSAGTSVVGVDLLYQGEFLKVGQPLTHTREVGNEENYGRQYAGYTFGYNHSVFAKRVHDILTVASYLRQHEHQPQAVHIAGLNGTGQLVATAAALQDGLFDRVAIDTQGFRFSKLERTTHPDFLPGGAKYGDVPGILALCTGHDVLLAGEGGEVPELVAAAFAAHDGGSIQSIQSDNFSDAAAKWLLHRITPD